MAVAEELHFGRAAERLHMTQPPLSRQVQLLEYELGVQLLERTTRSVLLTPAGKAFLLEATRLLRTAAAAAENVARVARGDSAPARLGFTAGASYEFLPKLLTRLRSSLPRLGIVLAQMKSSEQVEALRANEIDVGLFRASDIEEPLEPNMEATCVAREKMLLAIPRQHRLAKGRLPDLTQLENEPFISFSRRDGNYFYGLVGSFFRQAAIHPNYVLHVSQIHSILALVGAGIGLSMIPESSRGLHYRGVVLRSARQRLPQAELHIVWKKDSQNPSIPALVQLARQLGPS